jgi:hypothetical protein
MCKASRNSHVESRVSLPEPQRKIDLNPILTFAAGLIAAAVVASAPVHAQTNFPLLGTQTSATGHEAQTGATVQRTRPVVRRAQTKPTVQRVQTTATVQRAETEPAVQPVQAKPTVQRAQTRAIVQRAQTKPAAQRAQTKPAAQRAQTSASSPRTVGTSTNTAAKQTKPDITKTAMPVPAPELLTAPPAPDCALDPTRATDDRQKLDYERQCYRHAEIIIRARFERLQDEVGKMIKAVKSDEGLSASR